MPPTTTTATEPSASESNSNKSPVQTVSLKSNLVSHLNLLQVARAHNDRRLVSRVLHQLPEIRRKLDSNSLIDSLTHVSVQLTPSIQSALTQLKSSELGQEEEEVVVVNSVVDGNLIERNAYILLLISVFLLDSKQYQASMEASTLAIMGLQGSEDHYNTFDPILARLYYFLSRSYELTSNLPALHNFLMVGLRTAALRHDKETQATIYNSILRLNLLQNDYESAGVFLKNSPFPTGSTNLNNQSARFHFYRARILAVKGNYFEATEDLDQSLRKVPHGHFALNFILSATKFSIVVQLLCGEIPDRASFNLHERALKPYLELTQSVRLGELVQFQQVVNRHMSIWTLDGTKILVERLHESVLRVGLRRLHQAYSKITLVDIAKKLGLPSEQDALHLVQKALNEGVIQAQINDQLNCLESKKLSDLYTTRAPQESFSARTQTLQNFHTEAVKAMRFPEKSSKSSINSQNNDEDRRPTDEDLMDEFMDADEDMF